MYEIKPNTIPWTKFRLLKIDDYQGTPPQRIIKDGTEKEVAKTVCKMDPRVLPSPCSKTEYVINYEIFALFICSKSYMVKDLEKDKQIRLLKHEQGHFDICEEHCRILRKKLEQEIKGKKFLLEGNSQKEKKLNVNKKAKILFNFTITESKKSQKTHELYDKETHHGMIRDKQEEYNERFAELRK